MKAIQFLCGEEYIVRQDKLPVGGNLNLHGGYLLVGYDLTDKLEAIARYEYFDRNTSLDDDHFTGFRIGASYYFVGNTRLCKPRYQIFRQLSDISPDNNLRHGIPFSKGVIFVTENTILITFLIRSVFINK